MGAHLVDMQPCGCFIFWNLWAFSKIHIFFTSPRHHVLWHMHGPLRLTYALLANYMAKCQMSSGPYGPIFTHGIVGAQSECFQGEQKVIYGVLSAAFSVAIRTQYMRGIRYRYTCRVLLTIITCVDGSWQWDWWHCVGKVLNDKVCNSEQRKRRTIKSNLKNFYLL